MIFRKRTGFLIHTFHIWTLGAKAQAVAIEPLLAVDGALISIGDMNRQAEAWATAVYCSAQTARPPPGAAFLGWMLPETGEKYRAAGTMTKV
jgi:hypothetical protein